MIVRRCNIFIIAVFVGAGPATSPAAGPPSDSQIARSLQEAFARDFRLKNTHIQVLTSSGSVTLRGTVSGFLEKQQAERIAKQMIGVRGVTNLIQVDSAARDDEELAADVLRRLHLTSFIRPINLQVRAADGVVTLVGQVDTWAQSRQAERVTGEVRGVKLVRNQLTLAGASGSDSARGDDQIQRDVQAEFRRDAYLAELQIRVAVEDGVVRIEGDVPRLYHKERATREAQLIGGVKAVDNRLEVLSQFKLALLPGPLSDEESQAAVLDELHADPRVAAGDIQVSSLRGRVSLSGSVASMFERQMAERIARRVVGVVRVENRLQVKDVAGEDDEILDQLRFNLRSDTLLSDQTIHVMVKQATVTLSGEVSDVNRQIHAERLAARVRGVQAISNELKVRGSASTSDAMIQQFIVASLLSNANTHPVADRIRVAVKAGIVTLTGHVDRSAELIEAERIAKFTEGVRAVDNQISLAPIGPSRRD